MLFAKTSKSASRLSESVRTRSFDKIYLAVVHGRPAAKQGRLKHYLRKDAGRNIVTVHDRPVADAKEAVLDYAVAAGLPDCTLVAVRLHTGRPHQIRAQMAATGCPLLFDRKYGAPAADGERDIALWSALVGAPHPVTKEWMAFRSVPPHTQPWTRFEAGDIARALTVLPEDGL
jgi:23S rRNA pseudouridine1911/1915/1917 synthase